MPEDMFTTVRRGYDPAEVERAVGQAQAEADDLRRRLEAAEAAAEQARSESAAAREALVARESQQPDAPTYEHLGERIGQILSLAEAEAAEIRDRVVGEVETLRKEAEQEVGALRADADRYAEETRRDADADGARILADARKAADGERDAAERDASARRAEAEALHEDQRAKAAQAAADFETTLAERRQKATAEFQAQQAAIQAELDAMAARNKDTEATLERNRREAEERIARMLADAEERSTTMVAEARATADRVRAESERELAAAGQRRDSINAQLSNVRQMLATLSGTVPGVVGLSDEAAPIAGAPQGDPLAHAARDLHEPAEGGAEPAETEDGDDVPDPEAAPDVPQDRDPR
jgi:hypothetical protein